MNLNVPGILDAAIPKPGESNCNVGIIAANMNGPNHNDPGFLSDDFPRTPPKLYITSEEEEFDGSTLVDWREEGFNVEFFPMGAGGKEYKLKLDGLRQRGLGPCETFGIVAYGEAASACLEHFHIMDNNPDFKLSCLIAYYPTRIPDPKFKFPGGLQVLVHLAGDDVKVVKRSQMVGIQGKKRSAKKRVDRGVGLGRLMRMAFSAFSYDADPGFAERDMDEYDQVHADLAWSRSLAAVRKAFRWDANVMGVVEENEECKFFAKDETRLMNTYTTTHTPHVTFMPTLVGGIGNDEIARFYGDFFMDENPDSLQVTLVSRTSSPDRVVDELHVQFDHTQGMPWMLPGIPPTNRQVEIMIISIVTLKGGKLCHEHIYWDQASVLLQIGLLNPKMVPKRLKAQGVEKLPVVGREAAERVVEGGYDDEEGEADNELLPEFFDYSDDEDEEEDEEGEEAEEEEDEDVEEIPRENFPPRGRQRPPKAKALEAPKPTAQNGPNKGKGPATPKPNTQNGQAGQGSAKGKANASRPNGQNAPNQQNGAKGKANNAPRPNQQNRRGSNTAAKMKSQPLPYRPNQPSVQETQDEEQGI